MGNVVRRIALVAILGAALATVVGDAIAQTRNPNRITRIEVLTPTGEPPRVRIYWNHIQRATSPVLYRVILGRVVAAGNADFDASRHEMFSDGFNPALNVAVGIECWVPVTVEESQELMCDATQYGNITTLAIQANQRSFLRIYGYNDQGRIVDIDPLTMHRDYIWIRANDPLGPIVQSGIANPGQSTQYNAGGVIFGAAAFPPAPTNTPTPTPTPTPTATPLPALNVGPQISADGGVIPTSGRDLPIEITHLNPRTRFQYRLTLTIAFDPTLTDMQAAAASGWDGVCGREEFQTVIRGQASWTAIARLRACDRPAWAQGVTGTTHLHYQLAFGLFIDSRIPIIYSTLSSGNITSLRLQYAAGPTPTPTPTAAPGAQPNADVWFNPVGSLGENVIGIGGDTAKAAMISALALAATVLAFQFSRSLPVAILGGTLVIIGGVPLGLTPIWVIAGLGMTGIVISGFALFFRGA